jgi:hypothetical protein
VAAYYGHNISRSVLTITPNIDTKEGYEVNKVIKKKKQRVRSDGEAFYFWSSKLICAEFDFLPHARLLVPQHPATKQVSAGGLA